MLSSISLKNFKSSRDVSIPLSFLTLLAGHNGSGKSSVLQAIAALRQTYANSTEPTGLHLSGPLIQLGTNQDVLSEGATEEVVTISIHAPSQAHEWRCSATEISNQLEFLSRPETPLPELTSPNFQYLQAHRIAPQTLYPKADVTSKESGFLGIHGEFVADFLVARGEHSFSETRSCPRGSSLEDETLTRLVSPTGKLTDQIAGWLQHISPGSHLEADNIPGTDEVVLRFRYYGSSRGTSNRYRPTNVGFGLTHCLPVIAGCLAAEPGSLLLLENPEAHLHPHGQTKLGELLAMCADDGVQIITETHSDHLLNGVRLAVKRKLIDASKISLCYFQRDVQSGDTFTSHPALGSDGSLSDWPPGFFDEWEKSLEELLI